MLKIRLQRVGRKHEPVFRLVLTDSKNSTKSGQSLEILGNFDARAGEKAVFKIDRVTYWISKGAQVTPTVHNLLVDKKVITGKKINVLPLKKAIVKEVPVAEQSAPAEATPAPAVAESAPEVAEEVVEVAAETSAEAEAVTEVALTEATVA